MKKEYNINEVANIFNITTNKIRYYEKKGLIKPIRDKNNEYRIFNEHHIMTLQAILLYRIIGLSINDIKEILIDSSNSNYLDHFNKQWSIINDEIHRLSNIRQSLEKLIDNLYENDNINVNDDILNVIDKTYKLNNIKNNWKDKWNFDSWAKTYDASVQKDYGQLKIYKNYNLILESVFNLVDKLNLNNPSVLEIGVGTGNLASKFLKNNYNIIGIDQSREMLSVAKEKYPKLKVRLGEFLKIPYGDKYFDVIISTYAFHHLDNNEKSIAIQEMLRVLKDGGKVIIGDLMFKSKEDEENILKDLSLEQVEEVMDEYYSHIDFLQCEFRKFNKKLTYKKIDDFNYIVYIE